MWIALLAASALCGDLVIDARVPVEIFAEGRPIAQVIQPAKVVLEREAGPIGLTLLVGGDSHDITVEVPHSGTAIVLVGRTGISASQVAAVAVEAGDGESLASAAEFRVTGDQAVTLILAGKRHKLVPGETLDLELAQGSHLLSLRSAEGTVVYAAGKLVIDSGPFVVQLSSGRMPEVSGAGAFYLPDGL